VITEEWKKSTRSNSNGTGGCVEIRRDEDGCVVVRDSKLNGINGQPVLCFRPHEWEAFLAGAKAGEFDL
jgi:hypothetical protein